MLLQCCTQYVSKFGKLSNDHRTGKGQFSFQSQKRVVPKNVQSTIQLYLQVMVEILQVRLQQFMYQDVPDIQAVFRKGKRTRDQIANIHWIMEKQESSRKTSISALLTMPKPLTVWITINCGKFSKRWEYQATFPAT